MFAEDYDPKKLEGQSVSGDNLNGHVTDQSTGTSSSRQEVKMEFAGLELTVTIKGSKTSEKDDFTVINPVDMIL